MMLPLAENFLSSFDFNFVLQCIFSVFSLVSGLFFGSVIRIFVPSKKKSCASSAFSAMCIFLTLLLLLYTAFIFLAKSLFPLPQIQKLILTMELSARFYYVFLAAIFVFGSVLFLFPKILLPLAIILYAALSFFTSFLLHETFGEQPQVIPVRVEKSAPSEIKIYSYTLSELAIFPIRRNWYAMNEKLPAASSPILNNPAVKSYLHDFILSKKTECHVLPLPEEEVYPSLYSIHVGRKNGRPLYSLDRDL